MAVDPLQLAVGVTSPELTAELPPTSAHRRIQGLVTDSGGYGVGKAKQVWCGKIQAFSKEEGLPPAQQQQHKRSLTGLWLDNRHNPPWEELEVTLKWDARIKRPSRRSVSASVQGQGASAARERYLQVGTCSKLCEDGRTGEAVDELSLLVQRGCHVPKNLFYRVLKRCKDLVQGRRIHALTVENGYEGDAFLATHFTSLYASHGRLEEAMQVFSKVCMPNAHNWATIIFAFAKHGEAAQAIRLYRQMLQSHVRPDNRIYSAVLKACAAAGDLVAGKEVHARLLAHPENPDIFVQSGLLHMYAKCGSVEDARKVFDTLTDKDAVTWTAMIAGYAQQGMGQEALILYLGMQEEGLSIPDSVTFVCLLQACASVGVGALHEGKQLHAQITERGLQDDVVLGGSLVNMYAKCGSLEDAGSVFDRLPYRNVVTWTAMIAGYAQQGRGQEALSLYRRMQQEGIALPNSVTFVCLLQACATVAALPLGEQLHAHIEERALQADEGVGKALVNMYAKCGSMVASQRVFDSLSERDIVAWGALIAGYTRQGDSELVFDLLDRMRQEGTQPDGITLLNVLTVCSHVSLVDKGRKYFEAMRTDYGISPTIDHYTCMLDLLGRAGHLHEALQMAITMPVLPTGAVWLTLLGACQKWNNVEIGRQAFEFAVTLDERDATSYVLMSNIYAGAQMWEEAKEMEARRKKCGAWKQPGQSWLTDTAGVVHTFAVGDQKSPESESIYARLVP